MMTKMKKMNVLNYQVTRFARDNEHLNIEVKVKKCLTKKVKSIGTSILTH